MSAVAVASNLLLPGLVLAPLVVAAGVLGLHLALARTIGVERVSKALFRRIGFVATSAQLVVGATWLWSAFDPEALGWQLVFRAEWLPQYGFHLHLAIDGLSLFPVLLALFIVPAACWSTPSEAERFSAGAVARVLAVQAGVLGVLLSVNAMQLHLFWTLLVLPTFFVIVGWGGAQPLRAAFSWGLPAALGSALMLFVLIVVHRMGYEQLHVWVLDLVSGRMGGELGLLDVVVPTEGPIWATQSTLFAVLLAAVAMRMRVFPFHVWSTRATAAAPPDGLVLLDLLQGLVGVYIVVRVGLPLLPTGAAEVAPWLSGLAVFGLGYGALVAGAQYDLRHLQAYAQTATLGLVALGVFTLGEHGIVGALVHGWSMALAGAAVLVLIGLLVDRRGSTELETFGGLSKPMPVFSLLFALSLFAFSGIPGTLGFVGELLVLAGGFVRAPGLTLAALLGVLLSGACLLRAYRAVALGPVKNPENRGLIDLDWRERAGALLLLLPVIVLGLHPNPLLRRVEPAVLEILHQMELRGGSSGPASSETATVEPLHPMELRGGATTQAARFEGPGWPDADAEVFAHVEPPPRPDDPEAP